MATDTASGGLPADEASTRVGGFRDLMPPRPGTVVGAPARTSALATILLGFGPTLLFIGLFWFLARRAQSGAGGLGGLGDFGRWPSTKT
jgi:ATP-dependent Zn protease